MGVPHAHHETTNCTLYTYMGTLSIVSRNNLNSAAIKCTWENVRRMFSALLTVFSLSDVNAPGISGVINAHARMEVATATPCYDTTPSLATPIQRSLPRNYMLTRYCFLQLTGARDTRPVVSTRFCCLHLILGRGVGGGVLGRAPRVTITLLLSVSRQIYRTSYYIQCLTPATSL